MFCFGSTLQSAPKKVHTPIFCSIYRGRRMVIVESPERPSTAGKQLGCQLVEMISGPPAVTENEKSSSLLSLQDCIVGRQEDAENNVRFSE